MQNMADMTDEARSKLFPIVLNDYNPAWPQWFAEEKQRLIRLIGAEHIFRITHIGSTAVPGLTAKPTIDILLEIDENTDIEKIIGSLPQGEYTCLRQQTISSNDRVIFYKGYTSTGFAKRVFHIHVRGPGDWDEVHFRDYLIAHPEAAGAYDALKRKLKEQFLHDRDGYTNAKGEFIMAVTKRARNIAALHD